MTDHSNSENTQPALTENTEPASTVSFGVDTTTTVSMDEHVDNAAIDAFLQALENEFLAAQVCWARNESDGWEMTGILIQFSSATGVPGTSLIYSGIMLVEFAKPYSVEEFAEVVGADPVTLLGGDYNPRRGLIETGAGLTAVLGINGLEVVVVPEIIIDCGRTRYDGDPNADGPVKVDPGIIVTQVTATDAGGATITYSIKSAEDDLGNDLTRDFRVTADGTVRYIGGGLDRETIEEVKIVVTATSSNGDTADATITVTIDDVDEFPLVIGGDLADEVMADADMPSFNPVVDGELKVTDGDKDAMTPTLGFEDTAMAMAMADGTFDLEGTYGKMKFNPSNNSWTYTLDNDDPATRKLKENETGTDTFTFKAGETTEDVVITVIGDNDAPKPTDTAFPMHTVGDFKVIPLERWFDDPEDETPKITIAGGELPPGMTFVADDGFLFGFFLVAGEFDIDVTATDSGGKSLTRTITIKVDPVRPPEEDSSPDAAQPPDTLSVAPAPVSDLSDLVDALTAANEDVL